LEVIVGQQSRQFAVITGASTGIGRALARQFATNGFDVLVTAENDLTDTVSELQPTGAKIIPVVVDLTSSDGVEQLYQAIQHGGRPVDAIAFNAGVGVGGEFIRTPLEDDLGLLALNITSVVHLAKRVLADMVSRGEGRVLFTASIASTMPGPFYATYAASKAFVLSFAQAIRYELKGSGVTVTALMPGPTDTNFFDRAKMNDTRAGTGPKDDPADVAKDGFEALMAGDDHVVAGSAKNAAQVLAAKVLPDTSKATIHARMTQPGSGKA
jgi:short-subunit dehydrogenase